MLCGPKTTVKKARKLRRALSPPEAILWVRLRQRPGGFKLRRQHPAGPYILDFFCSEALLAIEVDGISHEMGDRPAMDEARDRWLAERGVATLRIAAADVSRDANSVIEWIVMRCSERENPLHRSSSGPPPRDKLGEDAR